jgi:hypothetical protein
LQDSAGLAEFMRPSHGEATMYVMENSTKFNSRKKSLKTLLIPNVPIKIPTTWASFALSIR